MKVRAVGFVLLAVLVLCCATGGVVRSSARGVVSREVPVLENAALALTMTAPDRFRLANKLSGTVYDVVAAPFEVLIESEGGSDVARWSDFTPSPPQTPS